MSLILRNKYPRNKINDTLMNTNTDTISKNAKLKSIYSYIDLEGIRQFLVYHPRMLLMFEILVHHIDDYVNQRMIHGKDTLNNSSHI